MTCRDCGFEESDDYHFWVCEAPATHPDLMELTSLVQSSASPVLVARLILVSGWLKNYVKRMYNDE